MCAIYWIQRYYF
jgi:hypothetical protein